MNCDFRIEDIRLITGKGRFVDDLNQGNVAYLGIVRSPYAHANIKRIDFSKISSHPDFIASLVGEDLLREGVLPITQYPTQKLAERYHLALNKARFSGEPVAAILSKNKYSLEDLIDEVEVDYEELPIITTIEESKRGDVLLYEDWKDNVSLAAQIRRGEADLAIRSARYVVELGEGVARQAGAPIEPRSVFVSYNKERKDYVVWASVQSAHRLQHYLGRELQIPKERFHVKVADVGGGFGTKMAQSYAEPLLACIFSKKTGMSVKWTSTRTEDLVETVSGRDEYCHIWLACDEDARIVGLKATVESDAGVSGSQNHMSEKTIRTMLGPYKIPNFDLGVTSYLTNKGPLGPVRGAGGPEGCVFIELAIDAMTRKIGIDPIDFRMKNVIPPNEFPYDNGAGGVYDSANYLALLDDIRKTGDYKKFEHPRNASEERLEMKEDSRLSSLHGNYVFGTGVSLVIESTGVFLTESAKVILSEDGTVKVYTGSSPHGQGLETTLAQLAAEELGVPFENVSVIWGDTDQIPSGQGTFGSRSITTGGSSLVDACRQLKSKIIEKVSSSLGVDKNALQLRNGYVLSKSQLNENALLSMRQVMNGMFHSTELSASSDFKLDSTTFSSSAHLCAVRLDKETGRVAITKYVVAEDCGRIINKPIVDGQVHGGVVHGIGSALFEQLIYDSNGHLSTSNFLDYTIPTSTEIPLIDVCHEQTPSNITLHGAKGVGESGTIGGVAAVLNALNDAISKVCQGCMLTKAPATPESVFEIMKQRQTS